MACGSIYVINTQGKPDETPFPLVESYNFQDAQILASIANRYLIFVTSFAPGEVEIQDLVRQQLLHDQYGRW